jgi:hypothetical protein
MNVNPKPPMNKMYIIGGAILVFVIIGMFLYLLFKGPDVNSPNVTVVGPFQLNARQSVIQASSFPTTFGAQYFLNEGTGTFQAYVYLDSLIQTGSVSDCGTRSNQPSCSSGLYDPCKCTSKIDCTNCSHNGYKNLVSLYGVYNLEVLPFPDASRQNTVSAQIAVNTQTAEEAFIETIPLPPIPLQKWVFLTISKTGRRIDIYYNDSLVSSSTLLNMITRMNPSGTVVEAGDATLSGSIGLLSMSGRSTTIGEVANIYSQTSDTRGSPNQFSISLTSQLNQVNKNAGPGILSSLCLDGSCLYLPRVGAAAPSIAQFSDSISNLASIPATSTRNISPAFNVQTQYV